MKPIQDPSTPSNPPVSIHSLEPLWIDYGVFPRLPRTGEDIYCDNLDFRFGLGYGLTGLLHKAGVPSFYNFYFIEEVFQNLVIHQARQDGFEKCIRPARQQFQACMAVSAPLKSGELKLILIDPPRQMDAALFCSTLIENSWLVLLNWKPDERLKNVLETCRDRNVCVCLGLPWHEEIPVNFSDLAAILDGRANAELVFIYSPPYLPPPCQPFNKETITALGSKVPVLLVFQQENLAVHHSELVWESSSKPGMKQAEQLVHWLAAYLKTRTSGSSIEESLNYTHVNSSEYQAFRFTI